MANEIRQYRTCSVGTTLATCPTQNAGKDEQDLLDQVKDKIIENSDGRDYSHLEAVFYKYKFPENGGQLFYIHAKTKDGKYLFVKVLKHPEASGKKPEYDSIKHDREQFEEINEF